MKIKFIGKKSLSSFIYWLLNIFLTLSIGMWPCLIMFTISEHLKGSSESYFYEITGRGLSMLFIKQPNNEFIANYNFRYILYSIPAVIVTLIINYYLMKIFGAFSENKVFEIENFKKSRIIGILILLRCVFADAAIYISALTINNIKVNGITFHTDISSAISVDGYIYGLMIIIISEIFRRSIIMKNEQDLTI